MENVKQLAKPWSDYQADAVWYMAVCSYDKGNYYRSQRIYDDYIKSYLSYKKYRPLDCWRLNSRDQFLSKLYYIRYMLSTTDDDLEKYLMISARWGNEEAIITCNKLNYKFWIEPSQYSYPY